MKPPVLVPHKALTVVLAHAGTAVNVLKNNGYHSAAKKLSLAIKHVVKAMPK